MRYLSINELRAKLGGISKGYVYRLIREKALPLGVDLMGNGGKKVWIESEIEAWMQLQNANARRLNTAQGGRPPKAAEALAA